MTDDGRGEVVKPEGFNPFAGEFDGPVSDPNIVATEAGEVPVVEVQPGVRAPVVQPKITPANTGKVSRTIDLGDGSGKQVFTADSSDELLDKLTVAQENATRKIREQQFELKRAQRAKPERPVAVEPTKKEFTADEMFAISNEMQKNPMTAIDKVIKAVTGKSLADLGDFVAKQETAAAIDLADRTFLLAHQQDFVPNAENAQRIEKFLTEEGLPHTVANLEYAFQELTDGGFPLGPDPTAAVVPAADGSRIVVKQHERTKPMSTGLRANAATGRGTDPVDVQPGALSESEADQIFKLPLEDARQVMLKAMARARSSQK
jgi:hypothetical protein